MGGAVRQGDVRRAGEHHPTGIDVHLIGASDSKFRMTARRLAWGLKILRKFPKSNDTRSALAQDSRRSCSRTCPLNVFALIRPDKANPGAGFHSSCYGHEEPAPTRVPTVTRFDGTLPTSGGATYSLCLHRFTALSPDSQVRQSASAPSSAFGHVADIDRD